MWGRPSTCESPPDARPSCSDLGCDCGPPLQWGCSEHGVWVTSLLRCTPALTVRLRHGSGCPCGRAPWLLQPKLHSQICVNLFIKYYALVWVMCVCQFFNTHNWLWPLFSLQIPFSFVLVYFFFLIQWQAPVHLARALQFSLWAQAVPVPTSGTGETPQQTLPFTR